jgi:hypothetical protein
MNYRGSCRHLIKNAKAAMIAAIEIYNKPRFEYRDECFVILLLNAWELALKATISKKGKSIYYPKKRKEPYKTLSLRDALNMSEQFFPSDLQPLPVRRNLELLTTYRDNAVHFYNEKDFGLLIYALAQTSIINFRDLLQGIFGINLGNEVSWQLMPLGWAPPIDPIEYISRKTKDTKKSRAAVRQFLAELALAAGEVEHAKADTARLLTIFQIHLQSTKKIQKADIIAGVGTPSETSGPLLIERSVDPNVSHPLRQKGVIKKVGSLHGRPLNQYLFQAIAWKYDLRSKANLCWRDSEGALTKYSNEIPAWLSRLSVKELDEAVADYREYIFKKKQKKN